MSKEQSAELEAQQVRQGNSSAPKHLPKWVLQLRAKVDASRARSEALSNNLEMLKANTEALGRSCRNSRKPLPRETKGWRIWRNGEST